MARLGIFGGSFDPVHRAHQRLAQLALEQAALDQLRILPAFRSPHKQLHGASPEERMQMLQLVFGGRERLRIDRRELDAGQPVRTVDTLRALRAAEPQAQWLLVIGQDNFERLDGWAEPAELTKLCDLVVCPRPGGSAVRPLRWRDSAVQWLDCEPLELSAASIRARLARGEKPLGLEPEVWEHIRAHGLYGFGSRA